MVKMLCDCGRSFVVNGRAVKCNGCYNEMSPVLYAKLFRRRGLLKVGYAASRSTLKAGLRHAELIWTSGPGSLRREAYLQASLAYLLQQPPDRALTRLSEWFMVPDDMSIAEIVELLDSVHTPDAPVRTGVAIQPCLFELGRSPHAHGETGMSD